MCNLGAVGLGLQGVSMLSGLTAEKKQAAAYADYQALSTQATLNNYIQQTVAINNRYSEEQEATALQQQQLYLQNLQSKATAQASGASNGVEGNTIENLYNGYDRATALSNYVSARNLQLKGLQYNDEIDSLRFKAMSSINLQQPYSSTGSSTLLSGFGGLMSSYSDYQYKKDYLNAIKSRRSS